MKVAVVYFSLEGNTEYVAQEIAKQMKVDIIPLIPQKPYPTGKISKFIWGGKSILFGETPKLKAYDFNVDHYDIIVIGTPIWAGTFTPPIKTFLRENNLSGKKVALYACHKGGGTAKCFEKLEKELSTSTLIDKLSLIEPKDSKSTNDKEMIRAFSKSLS